MTADALQVVSAKEATLQSICCHSVATCHLTEEIHIPTYSAYRFECMRQTILLNIRTLIALA